MLIVNLIEKCDLKEYFENSNGRILINFVKVHANENNISINNSIIYLAVSSLL